MSFLLGIIYLSFISLGLPDALLGSAWPNMYPEFQVPVSYAGMISMIIAFGTILFSLQSDRLTKCFGTGKVTAASVGITALALWGFSVSHSFLQLCLWAIPYGLGAGSVDASLNNYVALHYASKHMSWLHCMWGVGTTLGPYIMGAVLTGGAAWNMGYRVISLLQIVLTAVLIISLPKWKEENSAGEETKGGKPLTLREIISIPGAKASMLCFFCYCAVEQTTMLWASSYLNLAKGIDAKTAASFAGMFCIGITVGRGINGFIAMKWKDEQMVRMGEGIILMGILVMLLPLGNLASLIGFSLIGLGCAPVYPCIIHSTPEYFGAERSQAMIGVQMASAYVGICLMPPFFGLLANHISIRILPLYLLLFLVIMGIMYELLNKK
ncbi:MFS transporter [Candidatus Merdisoma sp. HCP28S3_D10]|uniref:MFS transporter n=1 Tax=unclassified Candidatus Merdisoma TaxID=3099611 RepID=UPI003F89C7F3